MAKRKTELITFRATVVETETYKSEGKNLFHAVLDSLPGEPQHQAQFFGFDDLFKVGDIHYVTFSRPVAKSARTPKSQTAEELRTDELKRASELLKEISTRENQIH